MSENDAAELDEATTAAIATHAKPAQQQAWPATLPEQVRAVADALAASPQPLTLAALEARFKGRGPWKKSLPTLLQTLEALGRAYAVQATDTSLHGSEPAWRS